MFKILHIIPTLKRAGAERLVIDICNTIINNNLAEVLLVVMYNEHEFPELTKNINIKFCSSRVKPSITGKTKVDLTEFTKIVEDFKPDIIHSHLYEAEMLSRWKLFPDVKYVSHCHDNMVQLNKISLLKKWNKEKITFLYERRILQKRYKKCKNNFIVISQEMKDFFIRNLSISANKFTLIRNAIDFTLFNKGISSKTIELKNEIVLISVGRLVDRKNHIFLIDVMKNLLKQKNNIKLFIIGFGKNKIKIENKINTEELNDKVFLIESTGNIEEYYNNADIYVHSAIYEPFGLVLLEANAAGLPVVCLNGKGNSDIIINDKNGYIINDNNIITFSNTILKIIENPSLYYELSKNSIEFAKNFDIEIYIKKLIDYYQKLLKNQ